MAAKKAERETESRRTSVRQFCSLCRYTNCSWGRLAMTPMTPFTVPKMTVGICAASLSGILMTSDPCRKRFTNSPRWNSPVGSRRPRSSSDAASLFFRTARGVL